MKQLIAMIVVFCFMEHGAAQSTETLQKKMIGTWELSKYLSTNNSTGNESPDKVKRVRQHTKSGFVLNLYNAQTGKLINKISGSYLLFTNKAGETFYEEKAVTATSDSLSFKSQGYKKAVSIDEADRMVFLWTNNFVNFTEIWLRVPDKK